MPFIGQQPTTGAYSKLDAITTSATATYNLLLDSAAYSPASANHLLVSLNGVMQAPQDSFTVSGSTITFASALTSSDNIDFIMALGDVLNIGTPSDGTVTAGKIGTGAVTDAKIASGISSSKLTGALPAISGAALTDLVGSLSYNGGTTLSNLRIQTGTVTTPNSSVDAGTAEGLSARYYNNTTVTLTGFASTPTVFAMALTNYHETVCSPIPTSPTPSASSVTLRTRSARTAGIQSISLYYIAIGQAS